MKLLHEKKREIEIPMSIVIENFCDLDHVNFVHKRCYKYCNIVVAIIPNKAKEQAIKEFFSN